ncbi:gamma-glutamylcyclotransferase [Methylicorpusculum sp.]|uniref:gamma-glutamylcyclotransferase family protein n=2 Tax=Methylicorpusculum sp. TaxID=2713644 RepID=UPI002731048C|nr:gamma-glutamylcyclotransferase family protein [Methylicorpusculum sp.]MDP2178708.1 gamma-glutamylcyclotransferase family protein [Methylicorpusculum sp.]MDP3527970.1 gamma-glutamylcyclotransferase family protein [Methylicorpusculum sp.]
MVINNCHYLFVYGSLRKGMPNAMAAWLEDQADWLETTFIKGHLFDIGDYPGAIIVPECADKVWGDLYRMQDELSCAKILGTLDEFEECTDHFSVPHEYLRIKTPVFRPNGQSLDAWFYCYNRPIEVFKRITQGDYVEYKAAASALTDTGTVK